MTDFDPEYTPGRGEPYTIPEGDYGTCPECGSGLENWGLHSDGDGDLYDALRCPNCQEVMGRANEHGFDDDGNEIDDG